MVLEKYLSLRKQNGEGPRVNAQTKCRLYDTANATTHALIAISPNNARIENFRFRNRIEVYIRMLKDGNFAASERANDGHISP